MMTPEHLKQLLVESEGLTIEYKECTDGLNNSVWETVCSFSNRYGRHLILGAKDNGTPIGVNRNAAQSKNPTLAKFFMNIARADQLGSGVRNLYKYTKLYSGGEPVLIEGDVFKTTIPLVGASEKQANNERTQANSAGEKKRTIIKYTQGHGRATVAALSGIFGLSDSRVRAILLEMAKDGLVKKVGRTKPAYYVLK
jgi:ATP-dependent DNA helicase RecG